ncbi:MAG TPA: DUF2695 domain-containing protein [Gemmatimonadales bacterium]|nr:DUF2695 domain-containing protein [Gemmatimonadales bacterium]
MNLPQMETEIREFVSRAYPNIQVRVEPWAADPTRPAVYFTEAQFASLYPAQRYHYLRHLIPDDFYERHLADSEWFELAPGERPEDLAYPDAELIADITPDVMRVMHRAKVFEALDDLLCPADPRAPRQPCHGDYRHARAVLLARRFREDELFDVLHVLMAQGGYCDCEILYNAVETSRLKAEYWRARADEIEPYDPHAGAGRDTHDDPQ